jgi:hypothetical protein
MADPVLPLELERKIFETTAEAYPKTAPTLLRVSRRVLIWLGHSVPQFRFRHPNRDLG